MKGEAAQIAKPGVMSPLGARRCSSVSGKSRQLLRLFDAARGPEVWILHTQKYFPPGDSFSATFALVGLSGDVSLKAKDAATPFNFLRQHP